MAVHSAIGHCYVNMSIVMSANENNANQYDNEMWYMQYYK
jgi:hypothetical protein